MICVRGFVCDMRLTKADVTGITKTRKWENKTIREWVETRKPSKATIVQRGSSTRLGQMEPDALTTMGVKANCLVMSLLCLLVVIKHKEPRTRQPSRFDEFYSRMRDDEFRATFRVPRPLFNVIVEDMRRTSPTSTYALPMNHVWRVWRTRARYMHCLLIIGSHDDSQLKAHGRTVFLNFTSFWRAVDPRKSPTRRGSAPRTRLHPFSIDWRQAVHIKCAGNSLACARRTRGSATTRWQTCFANGTAVRQ